MQVGPRDEDGTEPDILVALANLYFESEREVAARGQRSAGALYRGGDAAVAAVHDYALRLPYDPGSADASD